MDKGTSMYVDWETRKDLAKIIAATGRNLKDQIRWMVKRELAELGLSEQSNENQPEPK